MYLIVDANVLLGAVLGRSIDLLAGIAAGGGVLLVPQAMMNEAQRIVANGRRVPAAGASSRLDAVATLVTILDPIHYEHQQARAIERLEPSGRDDWPLLAAALALDSPVWSNDKHLWGTGVAVWRTRNIAHWTADGS